MSSNRNIRICDAIISESPIRNQTPRKATATARNTGPVRLPLIAPEAFVEQFNQIYGAIGMRLTPVQSIPAEPQRTDGEAMTPN